MFGRKSAEASAVLTASCQGRTLPPGPVTAGAGRAHLAAVVSASFSAENMLCFSLYSSRILFSLEGSHCAQPTLRVEVASPARVEQLRGLFGVLPGLLSYSAAR